MKMINKENAKSIKGVTFKSEMTASLFCLLKSLAISFETTNPFPIQYGRLNYWQNSQV